MSDVERRTPRAPEWARSLDEETFSWEAAVGGRRGLVESILPGLLFVVAFVLTRDVVLTSAIAAGTAFAALALRLLQRQGVSQALSGLLGVGIGVVWALASGRGEDFYAWGLIMAAVFFLAVLVSLLVRRPVVALGVGAVWELGPNWTAAEPLRPLARRCTSLTWAWAALFAIRLAVEVPLWAAGAVAELGVAKLVLGVPLFAVVCWITWMGIRPFAELAKGRDRALEGEGAEER